MESDRGVAGPEPGRGAVRSEHSALKQGVVLFEKALASKSRVGRRWIASRSLPKSRPNSKRKAPRAGWERGAFPALVRKWGLPFVVRLHPSTA
jgi:hypothetical protein